MGVLELVPSTSVRTSCQRSIEGLDLINDMLLRLHYIYEKPPKKCRELEEVIKDLQQCLQFDDAGVKHVRASGSRWVTHKLSAMKRVLSKFGAYTGHLIALSEDHSVKAVDRAKLTSGACMCFLL